MAQLNAIENIKSSSKINHKFILHANNQCVNHKHFCFTSPILSKAVLTLIPDEMQLASKFIKLQWNFKVFKHYYEILIAHT